MIAIVYSVLYTKRTHCRKQIIRHFNTQGIWRKVCQNAFAFLRRLHDTWDVLSQHIHLDLARQLIFCPLIPHNKWDKFHCHQDSTL